MDELLSSSLRMATPLAFAAYGGALSERSGVFNVALEGALLSGAFAAALGAACFGSTSAGLLLSLFAGVAVGLVLSFLTVTLGANQFVSGIAVNMLCIGLTAFFARALGDLFNKPSDLTLHAIAPEAFHHMPILGPTILSQNFLVCLSVALAIALTYLLHRTRTGMNIRAVGENQKAADFAGLPVNQIRFWSVLASCAIASLGGSQLVLGQVHLFSENMTAGRGFIALAAVILGRRSFWGAAWLAFYSAYVKPWNYECSSTTPVCRINCSTCSPIVWR